MADLNSIVSLNGKVAYGGMDSAAISREMWAHRVLDIIQHSTTLVDKLWRPWNMDAKGYNEGDTIKVELPQSFVTKRGIRLEEEDYERLFREFVEVKLDIVENIALKLSVADKTKFMDTEPGSEPWANGAVAIASVIDDEAAKVLTDSIAYTIIASDPTKLRRSDITRGKTAMMTLGIPMMGIKGCLHPEDHEELSKEVLVLPSLGGAMQNKAYSDMYDGMVGGFPVESNARLQTFTTGPRGGTPLVAGSTGNVGKSISVDGLSPSITGWAKKGESFTIPGVRAVLPQGQRRTTHLLRHFILTEDVNSDAQGRATLKFEPEINDGSLTIQVEGETPISKRGNQNVSAAPADNAAITMIGKASTDYRVGVFPHKECCVFLSRSLVDPKAAAANTSAGWRHIGSGINLSVYGSFDIDNITEKVRGSTLFGIQPLRHTHGFRVWIESIER